MWLLDFNFVTSHSIGDPASGTEEVLGISGSDNDDVVLEG